MSKLKQFFEATHTNLGIVFYPKHFIFAAFPSQNLAEQARHALSEGGFPANEMEVASVLKSRNSLMNSAASAGLGANL